jgi:transaldolase
MKLFIDTANLDEIRKAHEWGILDGVTTNPTLIAKEGRDFKELLKEICQIVKGPVNAEAISSTAEGMIKEAKELSLVAENIVVKIPMTPEGLKAVKQLKKEKEKEKEKEGIKTNVTLIFSPTQALLAAKAGADYISPFVGRLDDRSQGGMELVAQIITIFENYNFPTQVIVASIRHPLHVVEAALMGADIATVPFSVLEKLFTHPLTDLGLKQFLEDWRKVGL